MPTVTGIASELITFSRTSNATLVDSDGRIKWAPHNLLLASEQFDAASWTKSAGVTTITANAVAAPNGTTTADLITSGPGDGHAYQTVTLVAGVTYTFSVWLKAQSPSSFATILQIYNSSDTGTTQAVNVTSDWQMFSLTKTVTQSSSYLIFVGGSSTLSNENLYAWGAHVYRSDLGGMKSNTSAYPTYNPTTAKNLLGFTEDFSSTAWTNWDNAVTVNADVAIAPTGLQTADAMLGDGTANVHYTSQPVSISSTGIYTLSVYAKANGVNLLQFFSNGSGTGSTGYANFNLAAGAIGTSAAPFSSLTITPIGNDGWYRCSALFSNPTGSYVFFSLSDSASATRAPSFTTSQGIYLWGAQLSDSASLDTYVPNYGAAPTAAAYYGPRLDYDPVTLAAKGLLVEEQRANALTYSSEFDNAAWSSKAALNTTGTPAWVNVGVAPDGTTTADRIIPNTNSDFHYIGRTVTVTSGIAYTASFYAKNDGYGFIRLYDASSGANTVFTLSGAGSTSGVTGTPSITPIGTAGWYRCTLTFTTSSTSCQPSLYPQSTASMVAFAGDGSSGVLLWGAQLEAGSFATSYIPVGSSTAGATRSADVASVSTQAFPYSATEGTLVANAEWTSAAVANLTNQRIALMSSPGDNYARQIQRQDSSATGVSVFYRGMSVGGVNIATSGNTAKIGLAWSSTGGSGSANGSTASALTGTPTTSDGLPINILRIGNAGDSTFFNGYIRQITYLPRRLSNAELQARTA